MRPTNYAEPFEDEELEARAWRYYETAREQGSTLSESALITECRELAHQDVERLREVGDEPVELADDSLNDHQEK